MKNYGNENPQQSTRPTDSGLDSSRRSFLTLAGATASGGLLATASQPAAARRYTIDSDLRKPVSTTGAALDQAIEAVSPGSPLVGLGDVFLDVQAQYGINAIYQAAHAAHESAWGRSRIARRKNNLFGWSAFDRCPGSCADSFASYEACVRQVMSFIDEKYISKDGPYYVAATLNGMNVHYATDPRWGEKIAAIMRRLSANLERQGSTFEQGTTVVSSGDVNLRTSPAIRNNVVFTLPEGESGVIRGGPRRADGAVFWQVEYDRLDRGPLWSAQRNLTLEQRTSSSSSGESTVRSPERLQDDQSSMWELFWSF